VDYGTLRDYVKGAMCKQMPAIDIPGANRSHQHEFQGSAPLKHLLGDRDRKGIPARFVYLDDDEGQSVTQAGTLSWYDSRRMNPRRKAEWRLYYSDNEPIRNARVGDTLTLALMRDDSLAAIITRAGATVDTQVKWLFGIGEERIRDYYVGTHELMRVDAVASSVLEALGIEVSVPTDAEALLLDMLRRYPDRLPTTVEFSGYCRSTLGCVDYARDDPDEIIYAAYQREEMLFRAFERHEAEREFPRYTDPMDVDGLLRYSMSLFQRRKSRAGKSLEHTLEAILDARGISYDAQAETENHEKPDFLFPSEGAYHDPAFPAAGLTLLGAKTTCKDRWRQVLSEGERVEIKHLVTLESAISVRQTDDMRQKGLQLVVPGPLHGTYASGQRDWLWRVSDFLELESERERRYFRVS
jgi:hypothetical protein